MDALDWATVLIPGLQDQLEAGGRTGPVLVRIKPFLSNFLFLSDPFAHVVRSLGQDVCPVFEYTGERFS